MTPKSKINNHSQQEPITSGKKGLNETSILSDTPIQNREQEMSDLRFYAFVGLFLICLFLVVILLIQVGIL